MNNKFIIPEGSIVQFELRGVGGNDIIKTAEVYENMEVLSNTILLIDEGLYCTDNIKPVKKIKENEFKIIIWLQDAYVVKGNCFYNSISEAD
ncbi:hypothetical protein AL714_13270 [Clostridium botulinum]|uniref:hypothetical protein n=1 Tax=Clostridium botulinum TaxID=1491 RepID=UPI0007DF86AD|nr:hypothetical protein [Clostridium botulinum]KEI84037.1 hypothetical protein N493_19225 [Clostridium botulinum B2 433]MBE1304213.1 hypothetical protein [Clostridium botulinum]MCC5440839.1 hypothetical protein [Clostridium botulinum]NFR59058.1 hypothetical protein [Clostridium botulinum]OPD36465.1 hypothetical protein AL714_13270 [Clostridium botulinum]